MTDFDAKTALRQALNGYPLHPATNARIVAVGHLEAAISAIEQKDVALEKAHSILASLRHIRENQLRSAGVSPLVSHTLKDADEALEAIAGALGKA